MESELHNNFGCPTLIIFEGKPRINSVTLEEAIRDLTNTHLKENSVQYKDYKVFDSEGNFTYWVGFQSDSVGEIIITPVNYQYSLGPIYLSTIQALDFFKDKDVKELKYFG